MTLNSRATVILLNYKRKENIPKLFELIQSQTLVTTMLLVNNSGMDNFGVERSIFIPWNGGCFSRILASVYAKTNWIIFICDDVFPKDNRVFEDALKIAQQHPHILTGAYGHGLNFMSPYYKKYDNQNGFVPLLKGNFIIFHKQVLSKVRLGPLWILNNFEYMKRCDDLYLSLEIGQGRPIHHAVVELGERLENFSSPEVGLCRDPNHYSIRDNFCRDYIKYELS